MKKYILITLCLIQLAVTQKNSSNHSSNISNMEIIQIPNENEFKNLQKSIILQRNYKCLSRDHFELTNLKEYEQNSEIIKFENLEILLEKTVPLKLSN